MAKALKNKAGGSTRTVGTDRAVFLLPVRQCSLRVKTDWRNRLNERNLTDLMRIKVTGPTLPVFRECFGELAVDLWNNDKARRTTQRKRNQYAARGNASKRTRETEKEEFLRDWLKDVGVEGEKETE